MSSPRWSRIGIVLIASSALAWSAAAWSALDPSGAPAGYLGSPVAAPLQHADRNDMLQPVPADRAMARAHPAPTDLTHALAPIGARVATWERLAELSSAQRANAAIELELGARAGAAERLAADRIASLWRDGLHEQAIVELRAFEESGGSTALGLAWTTPAAIAALPGGNATNAGGTDVRIGTRSDGHMVSLGFDPVTGAWYAVVGWGPASGGPGYWTVNRSIDQGATWTETYSWFAGSTASLLDVSATIVGGYIYVGYVPSNAATEYRLRRLTATTGAPDNAYGYKVVVDTGALTLREVTVVSNALTYNNMVYCFAIQSDDAVRFFYTSAATATTFTENSPAGASAAMGLAATWNPGYATYYLHVAYSGTDGYVHAQRFASSPGWSDHRLLASDVVHRSGVSISAWHDVLICAYEHAMDHGRGIVYAISYSAGVSDWDYYNYIFEPDGSPTTGYQNPSVDTHNGFGCSMVATAECGEPDRVVYRKRPVFAPGLWQDETQFNDFDVSTGTPTCLAPLYPTSSTFHQGATYFYGGILYFDRPMLGTLDAPGPLAVTPLRLDAPAPSPFSGHAMVRFSLPAAGDARLEVFDVRGARIATLADGAHGAGEHVVALEGGRLASGVYFCRLTAGAQRQVARFVVMH